MKLFLLDNDVEGVWYFTDTAKAARYIETSQSYLDLCRKLGRRCKGWSIEEIDDDNVISRYINPKKK